MRLLVTLLVLSAACVAPRSFTQSGRVTPRGEIRGGAEALVNVSTATTGVLGEALVNAVEELRGREEGDRSFDGSLNDAAKGAIAWGLDPAFATGFGVNVRYGVYDNVDLGYRYALGAHVLDARYQFMGPAPGRARDDGAPITPLYASALDGSIGLQWSSQSYELPSVGQLDKIGSLLGFHMDRTDFLVPVAFSLPFGENEKYGAFGFGGLFGYTRLSYGLEPKEILREVDGVQELVDAVSREQGFVSYGGFLNVKVGYRYAYAGLALALYHQNFGRFDVLDRVSFDLKGFTVVPSFFVEGRY